MAQIPVESLDWQPERNSQIPLHDQIVAWMKAQVSTGAWPMGSRLPTQRDLASALRVNRSTLVAALAKLAAYGIIEGKGAAGTFVASNSWSILMADRTSWSARSNVPTLHTNGALVEAIRQKASEAATICLGSGAMDASLFPMESWQGAMERMGSVSERDAMEEKLGLGELRREIARRSCKRGMGVDADQVLVTSGNLQSMRLVCQGLLEPGSDLLVARPTYAKGLTMMPEAGVRIREVAVDDEGIVPEALEAAARQASVNRVLYAMPTNHNPTGRTMGAKRRRELMALVARMRMPVVEDGSFDELCWGEQPKPLRAYDTANTVVYLGTAAKSFAPGLRVGWIVAPESIVARLSEIKSATDYGAATPSQMMLTQILQDGSYDRHLSALRKELEARCASAMAACKKHLSGIATWTRPLGGYFTWVTFEAAVPKEQLFTEALAAGVMLNAHDMFDHKHNNSVRMSFAAVSPERFEAGVKRVAAIVRKLA